MPDPTFPGVSQLLTVANVFIGEKKDDLQTRHQLAKKLNKNAKAWTKYLVKTFNELIELEKNESKQAAFDKFNELLNDYSEVEYDALKIGGTLSNHLAKDDRFVDFVEACARYYESALEIKRLMYEDYYNPLPGNMTMQNTDIKTVVDWYTQNLQKVHEDLLEAYHKTLVI